MLVINIVIQAGKKNPSLGKKKSLNLPMSEIISSISPVEKTFKFIEPLH